MRSSARLGNKLMSLPKYRYTQGRCISPSSSWRKASVRSEAERKRGYRGSCGLPGDLEGGRKRQFLGDDARTSEWIVASLDRKRLGARVLIKWRKPRPRRFR